MDDLYRVRPISDRTPFRGIPATNRMLLGRSSWAKTLDELRRELDALDARNVVLEVDVRERDITVAGQLRANASTAQTSPAVRLSFETGSGPMQFATDVFGWDYRDRPLAQGWQQNVRAIVLGLESLRRVERYGIAQSGQQYRGYLAIESGLTPTGMSVDIALQVIADECGDLDGLGELGHDLALRARAAKANAHPDRNHGDRSRWNAVEEAVRALTKAGRL